MPPKQLGHKADSPDIFIAVLFAEAESAAKVKTHFVAIQQLNTMTARP
jgi:hypothetical protein